MGPVCYFLALCGLIFDSSLDPTHANRLLILFLGCARRNSGRPFHELTTVSVERIIIGLPLILRPTAYGDLNLIVSCLSLKESALTDDRFPVRLPFRRGTSPIDLLDSVL